MTIGAASAATSGIHSASRRLEASAHNVANLQTPDFRPLETLQTERREGGSQAVNRRSGVPRAVDLPREIVESELASIQALASMRVLDTDLDLIGQLLDVDA